MKMQKIDWKGIARSMGRTIKRKSPEILTGIGIGGMLTTTVLAVRATPEALRRIEEEKRAEHHKKLTAMQTVRATWKCYIPACITGTVSTACLIGASAVNGRRRTALATAASLAETSLREYRAKVVETLGERKEDAIRDAIDRDKVEHNPPPTNTSGIPITEGAVAPVLCLDAMFGRYFYSDVETLKRAANNLNWQMNNGCEPYISLNEFYMEIGLSVVDVGDDLGWRNDRGLIDLHFSSQLLNGSTPCLVVSHNNPPEYGYSES